MHTVSNPSRFSHLARIERAFSRRDLKRVCEASESSFGDAYDMERVFVDQRGPENFYFYKNNGSNVVAVAHLDTVGHADDRIARFVVTEGGGTVVFSRALDDRLGAYVILELLPALGLTYDILLTVGEESGQSTAAFFEPPTGKQYDYMIEFDRGGTDVVMYQYEDAETIAMVRNCGAKVGNGSFSDISYLEHVGIKGYNWGVGYRDYHGPRAHAFLDDTFDMVSRYLVFADQNAGVHMPHYPEPTPNYGRGWGRLDYDWNDDWPTPSDPSWYEEDPLVAAVTDPDPDSPDYDEYPSIEALERAMTDHDRD